MTPLVGQELVHADAAALARAAADDFARLAREAVEERGSFSVALTGGSSPADLYRLLGREPVAAQIPWSDVHLFWGDDRVVPPAHPRSNFRLAERLFIGRVPLPHNNVHRIAGELGARRAAERYAAEVEEFFSGAPRFDLVYLGLGDDGHVASLFPFDAETLLERRRFAMPSLFRDLGEWRVTLTYPSLNAARRIEFLLPSPAKSRIARLASEGPIDPLRIPAQGIRPAAGTLLWRTTRELSDAAVATDVERGG